MKTKLERKIKMSNGGLRTIKEIFYRYAMKHQIKRNTIKHNTNKHRTN